MTLTTEMERLQKTAELLRRVAERRRTSPVSRSEALYYDLVVSYLERILTAKEQGKQLAAHSVLVPAELFYAMDVVPLHLELVGTIMPLVMKEQEGFLSRAKGYGLTPEVCSTHRFIAASAVEGWLPRPDIVVWNNQVCDNTAKSNDLVVARSGAFPYYFDCPYHHSEPTESYLAQELQELVNHLERLTGRKVDPDRLREVLAISHQTVDLIREIHELRKGVPSPGHNALGSQMLYVGWYFAGSQEGLDYFRAVRDELKQNAVKPAGPPTQERFRLLSLFVPPGYHWKLLRWMEREHGAAMVAETYCTHWGNIEWDYSRPYFTLARKVYAHPICWTMHGPLADGLVPRAVQDAISSGAQGAVYWAHVGCRQACAVIRSVKDALSEKAGIPLLALDIDLNNPTYAPEEGLMEKLEGFFEMLEG